LLSSLALILEPTRKPPYRPAYISPSAFRRTVDYDLSVQMVYPGPAEEAYTRRRTAFREHERVHNPSVVGVRPLPYRRYGEDTDQSRRYGQDTDPRASSVHLPKFLEPREDVIRSQLLQRTWRDINTEVGNSRQGNPYHQHPAMATPGGVAHTAWCKYNGQGLVKVECALGTRASIGPLPLLELLGEGGFGTVYRTELNGNSLAPKVTRLFSNRDRSIYVTDLENL
jgi:hypothetical protein